MQAERSVLVKAHKVRPDNVLVAADDPEGSRVLLVEYSPLGVCIVTEKGSNTHRPDTPIELKV